MKDNDAGESRENQIAWSPSADQAWRNPSLFGTLILTDGVSDGIQAILQATAQPGGSYQSPWFGEFRQSGAWVNHAHLRWTFFGNVAARDNMIVFHETLNAWLWTSRDVFPFAFDFSQQQWVFFLLLPEGETWIYNLGTGEWSLLFGV